MDGFKKIVKMKTGGLVKTPVTGDKKANAPSKAAVKPALKGSDVAKEKSKPAGTKDAGIKSKETGPADASSAAVKGRNKGNGSVRKFKTGGAIKKYADGSRVTGGDIEKAMILNRLSNMRKLGPAQQSQAMNQNLGGLPGAAPAAPTPAPAVQAPGGTSPAGAIPAQKRGGKVKKGC
jgi:hypothetical protein